MRNTKHLSSLLITLLVLSNLFASATVIKTQTTTTTDPILTQKNTDEWYDGSFHGTWKNNNQDGTIHGNINLGRNANTGRFHGQWTINQITQGTIKGRFNNELILGILTSNEQHQPFVGKLTHNQTHFTATITIPPTGKYNIEAEYQASFLPPLTGPYGIGIKTQHLIDHSRPEPFTPDNPNDVREMMIQIWYPIDKNQQAPPVEYMDPATFAWLKNRSPVPLFTIPDNAYQFVQPHGIKEPPMSKQEATYPVIIFSPGYDGVYQIYTSFIENIVSHGFIVVSINHPYVSGITVFPDGRTVYLAENSSGNIGLRSVVEDAKFVLDTITEMNTSDPHLRGRCDLSNVGMYGHSFGGASTSICCYEDDRFQCGLTLDGVFYLDEIPQGLNKPFLLLIAERRFNDENVQQMWNNLHSDAYKAEIMGSTHYAFTDVGVLLRHLVPLIPPNLLGFGTIEPKRQVNITRVFALAFFEVYLKGKPVEHLVDMAQVFEDVNFETKR